jgi:hypothetical protein
MKFSSFLDIKNKKIIEQLEILEKILSKKFKVDSFLQNESPYVFVYSQEENLPFQGVRIYKVGSNWAYRIQNENETQPYGKAYPLKLEEIYENLVADSQEKDVGEIIANALIEEFENFFKKSSEAEMNNNSFIITKKDVSNQTIVGRNSGDFSNMIYK